MEIKSVIVTKSLTSLTANAFYQLETSVTNGVLNRLAASVYTPQSASGTEEYIGHISYENHNLSCSFITAENVAPYFEDFEHFMVEVRKDMQQTADKA